MRIIGRRNFEAPLATCRSKRAPHSHFKHTPPGKPQSRAFLLRMRMGETKGCAWSCRFFHDHVQPFVFPMHHQHVGGCYGTVPLRDSVANARLVCFVIAPVRSHFSAAPHFAAWYLAFHLRSHCAVRHDSAHCTISNMPSRTNAPVRSTRIGFVWFALYARALVASCLECGMWSPLPVPCHSC